MMDTAREGKKTDALLRKLFPKPPSELGILEGSYRTTQLTLKRLANLHLVRWEYARGAERLRSRPLRLVIEATNVCNLKCPACFTGAGENGRVRMAVPMDFYLRVLDELADTLFEIEFYNWGEPLLNKSLEDMIEAAHARGLTTTLNSNFSMPFDDARAERLVKSGLTNFAASIGGATQETYAQYRRGGDFELVIENCRKLIDARKRLGATNPMMLWNYHVFPYNQEEIKPARRMSRKMGFDHFFVAKGFLPGPEWDPSSPYKFLVRATKPARCNFLWQYAVINNDGGVSPCCGTFYKEDDVGQMKISPTAAGSATFAEIWNSPELMGARAYFKNNPDRTPADNICRACPLTTYWHDSRTRLEQGIPEPEEPPFSGNDGFNYFFNRKPKTRDTTKVVRKAPAAAQD